MHMHDDDKEWVKLNYSNIKDDKVLLDSLRDCHVEGIKFGLCFFVLGLLGLIILIHIAVNQNIWYYYIFTIPCLPMIIMGICIFVSRAHCWINPRFNEGKYLDELTDVDAFRIRCHAQKSHCITKGELDADKSIEDILTVTNFYIDG